MEKAVEEKACETHEAYQRTKMQRDMILERLRDQGCRITRQRQLILDIILEEDCSCCKEIYYRASRIDPSIGTATVYRMINKLEEIGAINRRNMYKVACDPNCELQNACTIELDDDTIKHLSAKNWNAVIQAGLKACGYVENQKIRSITMQS